MEAIGKLLAANEQLQAVFPRARSSPKSTKEQCFDLDLFIVPSMNHYSSSLPDWYALTSPKYKVISKASIAAGLAAIYKDR